MIFDLFVLNRVSLSRLIWYARWILFVLQVYKSNDVSLLWRAFCPLSLTGWQNLGCCAIQGMHFRDFCPTQKNQILDGSPMLKWLSTLPPGIVMSVLRRSDFDSWPVSSLRQKQNWCICTAQNCAKKLHLDKLSWFNLYKDLKFIPAIKVLVFKKLVEFSFSPVVWFTDKRSGVTDRTQFPWLVHALETGSVDDWRFKTTDVCTLTNDEKWRTKIA